MTDPLSAARAPRTTIKYETEETRRLPASIVDGLIEARL